MGFMKNIREAMEWDKVLDTVQSAVVLEAGPLGLEMVTALAHRGIETHLVDPTPWALSMATDPDIFFNGERWVLYVSVGSNVIAFTSPVLEGPYDLSSSTVVSTQAGGVPAGILGTDGVWTYVNRGQPRDNISILRAVSATGSEPIPSGSFTTVLTGSRYGAGTAESPGVAANAPGIPCGSGCASDRPLPRPGRVSALKVSGLKRTSATVTWRPPTSGSGARPRA